MTASRPDHQSRTAVLARLHENMTRLDARAQAADPAPPRGGLPLAGVRRGMRRHILAGGLAAAVLVFGLGGMAATIDFAGAVVAQGHLVVDGSVKNVQHVKGGTVRTIEVKDGDNVKAGQILVTLDATVAAASLAIVTKRIDELEIAKARLQAERDGMIAVAYPPEILARSADPLVAAAMRTENVQFETRLAARDGERDQLRKKIAELAEQVAGIEAQKAAVERQAQFTRQELAGLKSLSGKSLVPADRMSSVERQAAEYDGQLGQLVAQAGQARAEGAQTGLQILQIDQDMRSDVAKQLAEGASELNELYEKKIAAADELAKLQIRAPCDGTVYQLSVHTIGSVVGPGETIMMIVPSSDALLAEIRVEPNEIDRVHPGLEADVRFTSFGARTTPSFHGRVEDVSPDLITDQRTGASYYAARIKLPPEAIAYFGERLIPGLPVEVFVATGKRTVLSYLTRPLSDQIMHAFRER